MIFNKIIEYHILCEFDLSRNLKKRFFQRTTGNYKQWFKREKISLLISIRCQYLKNKFPICHSEPVERIQSFI